MRRWLFALLLLANVGLLLWGVQYVEPERPSERDVPPDANPERMKLLSEVPPTRLVPRPKPAPPPPPTPTADGQACYRLGPVAQAPQVKKVEQALATQSLVFTRREEVTRSVTGYRVFLPSFPSRAAADRERRELTRLGFRDHALMHEEGFENAISLGVYTVEANAEAHLKRLADKSVKAKLKPVEQSQSVFWLDVTPAGTETDISDRLKATLEGIPGAEVSEFPCPAPVAPSPTITDGADSSE